MTEKMTGCPLPLPNANWALFLDIDGTLLDIADTPTAVVVPLELPTLLKGLLKVFDNAVALVSGRSLSDIDRLFAPLKLPAAGQHGAEIRLVGGAVETQPASGGNLAALLPDLTAFVANRPGLLLEDKGRTIAVHYRHAPQYQPEIVGFLDHLVGDQSETVETIGGHRVFEIKPRAFNKGTAVARLMQASPFAGRCPVFIGDDRTDEDGFAFVRAQDGHAIRVGLEGPSIAETRIAGPNETRAWLANVRDTLTHDAG
jgi:trehalose 6-phosphate phosphatase